MRFQQSLRCGRMAEVRSKDLFGKTIQAIVRKYRPKKILEIGSWDGSGSTACLLRKMFYKPEFIDCVEVCPKRAAFIQKLVVPSFPFVRVHNCSSISYEEWSFKDFKKHFWDTLTKEQQSILKKDDYYKYWQSEERTLCMSTESSYFERYPNQTYDFVLIDGAEFTGVDEYRLLKGRFNMIAMDDVFGAFKCTRQYQELIQDPNFELITASSIVRNGFAVFARKGLRI